jgi:hypothetical protein
MPAAYADVLSQKYQAFGTRTKWLLIIPDVQVFEHHTA